MQGLTLQNMNMESVQDLETWCKRDVVMTKKHQLKGRYFNHHQFFQELIDQLFLHRNRTDVEEVLLGSKSAKCGSSRSWTPLFLHVLVTVW